MWWGLDLAAKEKKKQDITIVTLDRHESGFCKDFIIITDYKKSRLLKQEPGEGKGRNIPPAGLLGWGWLGIFGLAPCSGLEKSAELLGVESCWDWEMLMSWVSYSENVYKNVVYETSAVIMLL